MSSSQLTALCCLPQKYVSIGARPSQFLKVLGIMYSKIKGMGRICGKTVA